MAEATVGTNVDPVEVAQFERLANTWWDPDGPFWPLHGLNALRTAYLTPSHLRTFWTRCRGSTAARRCKGHRYWLRWRVAQRIVCPAGRNSARNRRGGEKPSHRSRPRKGYRPRRRVPTHHKHRMRRTRRDLRRCTEYGSCGARPRSGVTHPGVRAAVQAGRIRLYRDDQSHGKVLGVRDSRR